jgi:hypothetical protein
MILTKNDLKRILLERPTGEIWKKASEESKKLQMHVLGIGLDRYIKKIEHHESDVSFNLRKKYGKTNRDIFSRLLRPVDAIWTGKGGSVFYDAPESIERKLRSMVADVYHGYQIRDWVRNFWKPRYIDDPQGIILMEVSESFPNGTYPTYKSSCEIVDAQVSGRRLEYLVLKTKDPQIFRVIDDALDRMVKVEGEVVQELKGKDNPTFINYFGQVPAIIISDIPKDGSDHFFASPIADEVELADIMLRDGTIGAIHRFKHGFPKAWKYPEVCGRCQGQKVIQGGSTCPDCEGTGVKLKDNPADIAVHAWPDKENPEIREKGGYISPDLEYLKYHDESLALLEEKMTFTHWGSYLAKTPKEKGEEKTATESFINVQPVNNRQIQYAKAAESVEAFITEKIGYLNFQQAIKGVTVNLGRRFINESPDALWTRYETARSKGAPLATLDDMLLEYYQAKFQGNDLEFRKFEKLTRIEPGVHMTAGEAKNNLPFLEFSKKIYFQEWLSTLGNMQINATDLTTLRKMLEDYTIERIKNAATVTDPALEAVDPATGERKPAPVA